MITPTGISSGGTVMPRAKPSPNVNNIAPINPDMIITCNVLFPINCLANTSAINPKKLIPPTTEIADPADKYHC